MTESGLQVCSFFIGIGMRETTSQWGDTVTRVSINELTEEDLEKMQSMPDFAIDDDYNFVYSKSWLADYHKSEYDSDTIIVVLPDILKKAIYKLEERATKTVQREFKRVLGM